MGGIQIALKDGKFGEAKEILKEAPKRNIYVPDYLTGRKAVYRYTGDTVTVGGDNEAVCYAEGYIKGWQIVPGAIDWLKKNASGLNIDKVGRNEQCPCGSGKKFKKCCSLMQ